MQSGCVKAEANEAFRTGKLIHVKTPELTWREMPPASRPYGEAPQRPRVPAAAASRFGGIPFLTKVIRDLSYTSTIARYGTCPDNPADGAPYPYLLHSIVLHHLDKEGNGGANITLRLVN